jgi:hypothetical protein
MAALTRPWVANQFVAYFSGEHHVPPHFFANDPDVKAAFNYSNAAWRELADVFNTWPWMLARGIAISQLEMDDNTTISSLTELVISKVVGAVAHAGAGLAAYAMAAKPKRKKAAKARATGKKATRRGAAAKKRGQKKPMSRRKKPAAKRRARK